MVSVMGTVQERRFGKFISNTQDMISFNMITCEKYADRLQACKETWAKNIKFTFLDDEGVELGWEKLPQKYERFFSNLKSIDHDWYVFCDDDVIIDVERLTDILTTLNSNEPICLGHTKETMIDEIQLTLPSDLVDLLNGRTFIFVRGYIKCLSRRAIEIIKNCHRQIPWIYEDANMGYWCHMNAIKIIHTYLFTRTKRENWHVAIMTCSPDDMRRQWKSIKNEFRLNRDQFIKLIKAYTHQVF